VIADCDCWKNHFFSIADLHIDVDRVSEEERQTLTGVDAKADKARGERSHPYQPEIV